VAEWLTFTPQPESSFFQDVLPRRTEDRQLGGLEGDLATVGDNLSFPRTTTVVFGSGVNIAWHNALNPFDGDLFFFPNGGVLPGAPCRPGSLGHADVSRCYTAFTH